jgi:hypothetical protein
MIKLSQFNLQLIHKPGKQMIQSDALSRRHDAEARKIEKQAHVLLPPKLFARLIETELDKVLTEVEKDQYDPEPLRYLNELLNGKEFDHWTLQWEKKKPILLRKGRRYVPNDEKERRKALYESHCYVEVVDTGYSSVGLTFERVIHKS